MRRLLAILILGLLLCGCQPKTPVWMYHSHELRIADPADKEAPTFIFYDVVVMPRPLALWMIKRSGLKMEKPLPEKMVGGKLFD